MKSISFVHIVAKSSNDVIGNGPDIPWKVKADLLFFKEKTMDHVCIVGRKTYETIKRLKNRHFVIVTTDRDYKGENGTIVRHNIHDAIHAAKELSRTIANSEAYIIGGSKIYSETFSYVDTLLVTEIKNEYVGDCFYRIPEEFSLESLSETHEDNGISFVFTKYVRKDHKSA